MEWNTKYPDTELNETTVSRRSDLIEFGSEAEDTEVHAFELCKGLICPLD
jgi:hypothetical protein